MRDGGKNIVEFKKSSTSSNTKTFTCFLSDTTLINKTNKLRSAKSGTHFFYDKRTHSKLNSIKTKIEREWIKAGKPSFDEEVRIVYRAIVPDKRNRDLDNQIKTLLDLLEKLKIIKNDKLVTQIDASKVVIKSTSSILFEIQALESTSYSSSKKTSQKLKEKIEKNRIGAHFTRKEAACHCGCGFCSMDVKLLAILEDLRRLFGQIKILSWCRCKEYNKKVGGATNSQHIYGLAVDIRPIKTEIEVVYNYLNNKYTGIGLGKYKSFLHLDVRGKDTRWRKD